MVEEAVKYAMSGPVLPPEELYNDIFCDTPTFPVRGCDPFTWGQSVPAAQ